MIRRLPLAGVWFLNGRTETGRHFCQMELPKLSDVERQVLSRHALHRCPAMRQPAHDHRSWRGLQSREKGA